MHDLRRTTNQIATGDADEVTARVAQSWRTLRRGAAARRLRALIWEPKPPQLTMGQVDGLDLLITRPSWNMIDFAAGLDLSPSGATRAADRLVTAGLAARTVCKEDKRSHLLSATRKGRRLQQTLMQSRLDIVSQALAGFDQAERAALADLTERFITQLNAAVNYEAAGRVRRSDNDDDPPEPRAQRTSGRSRHDGFSSDERVRLR